MKLTETNYNKIFLRTCKDKIIACGLQAITILKAVKSVENVISYTKIPISYKGVYFPFGRICNPAASSICICNAKTMKFFVVIGLQIQSSTRRIANPTEQKIPKIPKSLE